MIIQGPLALDWHNRKWSILPRIENADISGRRPVTPARVANWIRQRIGVTGKPDWIFIKAHTHGCQETNYPAIFDGHLHEALRSYQLHYVTARELYNLIKASEAGQSGKPNSFRNFILPPPPTQSVSCSVD